VAGFVLPLGRAADVLNHDQSVHLLDAFARAAPSGRVRTGRASTEIEAALLEELKSLKDKLDKYL
jgi:hypothetical protein